MSRVHNSGSNYGKDKNDGDSDDDNNNRDIVDRNEKVRNMC